MATKRKPDKGKLKEVFSFVGETYNRYGLKPYKLRHLRFLLIDEYKVCMNNDRLKELEEIMGQIEEILLEGSRKEYVSTLDKMMKGESKYAALFKEMV